MFKSQRDSELSCSTVGVTGFLTKPTCGYAATGKRPNTDGKATQAQGLDSSSEIKGGSAPTLFAPVVFSTRHKGWASVG
jgi:hypothetical protein